MFQVGGLDSGMGNGRGCGVVWEGWAIGIPAGYQPLGRCGLTDGKPRAAGWKDASSVGCGEGPRGGCGGAVGGGGRQGGEGRGEREEIVGGHVAKWQRRC